MYSFLWAWLGWCKNTFWWRNVTSYLHLVLYCWVSATLCWQKNMGVFWINKCFKLNVFFSKLQNFIKRIVITLQIKYIWSVNATLTITVLCRVTKWRSFLSYTEHQRSSDMFWGHRTRDEVHSLLSPHVLSVSKWYIINLEMFHIRFPRENVLLTRHYLTRRPHSSTVNGT